MILVLVFLICDMCMGLRVWVFLLRFFLLCLEMLWWMRFMIGWCVFLSVSVSDWMFMLCRMCWVLWLLSLMMLVNVNMCEWMFLVRVLLWFLMFVSRVFLMVVLDWVIIFMSGFILLSILGVFCVVNVFVWDLSMLVMIVMVFCEVVFIVVILCVIFVWVGLGSVVSMVVVLLVGRCVSIRVMVCGSLLLSRVVSCVGLVDLRNLKDEFRDVELILFSMVVVCFVLKVVFSRLVVMLCFLCVGGRCFEVMWWNWLRVLVVVVVLRFCRLMILVVMVFVFVFERCFMILIVCV